jgi:uncharacterized protein DUF4337
MSLPDALESSDNTEDKFVAVYIAVLAVILAITSVGGDNATKDMIRSSIQAADTYSFYQAKNIRQTSYELAADEFEAELAKPGVTDELRKLLTDKIEKYHSIAKRYESDPDKKEGKKELLAKAKDLESQRDLALTRDPYFDFAAAMLQIAIVLASASIILEGKLLRWLSVGLGIFGSLFTFDAFTLLVTVPGMN